MASGGSNHPRSKQALCHLQSIISSTINARETCFRYICNSIARSWTKKFRWAMIDIRSGLIGGGSTPLVRPVDVLRVRRYEPNKPSFCNDF
jgi:hypothetical protein